jgi:hypothetical protein
MLIEKPAPLSRRAQRRADAFGNFLMDHRGHPERPSHRPTARGSLIKDNTPPRSNGADRAGPLCLISETPLLLRQSKAMTRFDCLLMELWPYHRKRMRDRSLAWR